MPVPIGNRIPKVWNKRTRPFEKSVYVGRPSEWGNPFQIGPHGDRKTVLEKYTQWVFAPEQKALRNKMRHVLRGQDLTCWCAPLSCHAEIILEIAASPMEP